MTPYKQFWLITAVALAGIIYLTQNPIAILYYHRFATPENQAVVAIIFAVFLYAYGVAHRAAWTLSDVARAADLLLTGISSPVGPRFLANTVIGEHLNALGRQLERLGPSVSDAVRIHLCQKTEQAFAAVLDECVAKVNDIQLGLFFLGLVFTVWTIVFGPGSETAPANLEQFRSFGFRLVQQASRGYLASGSCLGGGLLLYVFTSYFHRWSARLETKFSELVFAVAFLTPNGAPASVRAPLSEEAEYETSS